MGVKETSAGKAEIIYNNNNNNNDNTHTHKLPLE